MATRYYNLLQTTFHTRFFFNTLPVLTIPKQQSFPKQLRCCFSSYVLRPQHNYTKFLYSRPINNNQFTCEYTEHRHNGHHTEHGTIPPILSLVFLATVLKANEDKINSPETKNKDIVQLLMKGRKLLATKCKLEKVEEVYTHALHLALERQELGVIAYVQDQLANLALRQNQLEKAEKLFHNVIRNLLNMGKEQNDKAILEISLKLATIYASLENHEFAQSGYEWTIETARDNIKVLETEDKSESSKEEYENQLALLGMVLDSYGRYLFVRGIYDLSLEVTKEAKDISIKLFGAKDIRTLVLYNDIGAILNQQGKLDEALDHIRNAIEVAEKDKKASSHSDLAVFYVNLANIYSRKGQQENAKKARDRALEEARLSKDKALQSQINVILK